MPGTGTSRPNPCTTDSDSGADSDADADTWCRMLCGHVAEGGPRRTQRLPVQGDGGADSNCDYGGGHARSD
jgi:hypothetical protein